MDALAFLRERTKTRTGRVLFCLLCLLPVFGGLVSGLQHHAPAFMDIDAVLCAAKVVAAGGSPYGALACPGLAPAAYVYAPQIAGGLAPLINAVGATGARWVYLVCLFGPASLALAWYALGRALPGVDWRFRLLAVSGLSPMAFCSGNFGMIMHAAVIFSLLERNPIKWSPLFGKIARPGKDLERNDNSASSHSALTWPKRKWAFTALVLACAVVKPTFLLYFLVYLFENRPWRDRLSALAVSGLAGIGVVAVTALTAGPQGAAWGHALGAVALRDQPGLGWQAFTAWLGLAPDAPLTLGLTLLFMAAMAASGVAIAEAAGLDDDERRVLALGLVPLLTPRLMDYDMLAVVPCLTLLMRVTPALGGRIYRYNVSWIFTAVLGFGAVNNVLHLHHWPRSQAAVAVFCAVVLAGGARLAVKAWEKRRGPPERKKMGKATSAALFMSGELRAVRTPEEVQPERSEVKFSGPASRHRPG